MAYNAEMTGNIIHKTPIGQFHIYVHEQHVVHICNPQNKSIELNQVIYHSVFYPINFPQEEPICGWVNIEFLRKVTMNTIKKVDEVFVPNDKLIFSASTGSLLNLE